MNVIFDLDGTLVDSSRSIISTYESIVSQSGITPAVKMDESLVGPSLDDAINILVPNSSAEAKAELKKKYIELYDSANYKLISPFSEIEELLCKLKAQKNTLSIATNKRETITRQLIKELNWGDFFQNIYCKDSKSPAYSRKAEMLLQLKAELNARENNIIYVGDSVEDMLAAEESGLRFFWAAWKKEIDSTKMKVGSDQTLFRPLDLLKRINERLPIHKCEG